MQTINKVVKELMKKYPHIAQVRSPEEMEGMLRLTRRGWRE